ncbi:MAG: YjbF family lipoprotein [Algiphilus sp.]|uniref:YjbF family lipoprotein n=1 Tax=Algiphilus sp. TaxID=1872431 RepID=UPI0032EEAE09
MHRKSLMVKRSILVFVAVMALGACRPAERIRTAVEASGDPQALVERIPLPYTQVRVQINGGTPGRLILAQTKAGVGQWIGSDGLRLWTRNGRIIATEGLRDDLHNTYPIDAPEPSGAQRPGASRVATHFFVRFGDPLNERIVEVTPGERFPPAPVVFGERVESLARYTESVHVPATGARWTNEYWFSAESGQVVITRQRLPGVPYDIRIEQLP